MFTFAQFIIEMERAHIGWIGPKGKDFTNKTDHDYHEDLLPRAVRPYSTSLNDYNKAFQKGYTRYSNNKGLSTFNHDAVHADPKKYLAVLSHIQRHLATHPYHLDSRVQIDLNDHKGNHQYTEHDDADSAMKHLERLKNQVKNEGLK